MKNFITALAAAMLCCVAHAQTQQEVGLYPTASPLTGSERMLADQNGITVDIQPVQITSYLQTSNAIYSLLPNLVNSYCLSNNGTTLQWIPCSNGISSIGLSMPSGFSVTGSPLTANGTLSVTTSLSGPIKGTGTGFAAATASDLIGLFTGCSGSEYLGADGACHSAVGSGTVTSVALAAPSWLSITGSPVTSSGTLTIAGASALTTHQVLGTGTTGVLGLETISAADLPSTINSDTTGNAASATALASSPLLCTAGQAAAGILANGNATGCFTPSGSGNVSTSGTTAQYDIPVFTNATGITGIAPSATVGEALISNGTLANPSFSASLDGVTSVNGTSIPAAATLLVSGGALGTPASGTLTNATGLPFSGIANGTSAGVTMTVGNGSIITSSGTGLVNANEINGGAVPASASVLKSNSSGQPVAATTTGTGSVVLATSPTLTTPNIGNATAGTLTNSGAQTNSAAGAASTAALTLSGAPYTAGTATTDYPLAYLNDGTAPTTWSTAGTELGINAPLGFTGNFLDFHLNGGASVFSVSSTGVITGSLAASAMPALTGDVTSSAGSTSVTVSKVNGASVPASASLTGTNSSSQFTPITVGTGLSLSGGTLSATGGSGVPTCTLGQLVYYAAGGSTVNCLTLGTNLSISSGTLNASSGTNTPGGSTNSIQYNNGTGFSGITLPATQGAYLAYYSGAPASTAPTLLLNTFDQQGSGDNTGANMQCTGSCNLSGNISANQLNNVSIPANAPFLYTNVSSQGIAGSYTGCLSFSAPQAFNTAPVYTETSSYTVGTLGASAAAEQCGLEQVNNAAGLTVSLPPASGSFGVNYTVTVQDIASAGTVTINTLQIGAPTQTAPSTSTSGGSLPTATAYFFKIVTCDAAGCTTPSTEQTITTGAGSTNSITLNYTGGTNDTYATSRQIWFGTATGAENQYFTAAATSTTYSFTTTSGATSGTIPAANTTASTINGASSISITSQYAYAKLWSDGTNWRASGTFSVSSSGGGATPENVQVFTVSGTWTKPSAIGSNNPQTTKVACIGGGGAGGSGASETASGTALSGGGGGGGAPWEELTMATSGLPSTVTVSVATAATGGAAVTGTVNGNNGANGGNTTFGSYLIAYGGGYGASGKSAATSTGGASGGLMQAANGNSSGGICSTTNSTAICSQGGAAGNGDGATGGNAASGFTAFKGGSGGGGGGGITTAGAASDGSRGGDVVSATGGTAGTGAAGGSGSQGTGYYTSGSGGGGGAGNAAGNGFAGGAGSIGSGGGGGGAQLGANSSGVGGNGGPGMCVVTTVY